MTLTARDVYDALADQLVGSSHYLGNNHDLGDLKNITVDGDVDCQAIAEFLNDRAKKAEK